MAPIGESCYFPPLDKCLDGNHQLLSWETTLVGLSQSGDISDNGPLKKHLSDSQTIDLLARALSPYSTPTAQTKSSFETRTSAINIPPSFNGRYDIKELKDDSLWLSDRMKIDEIAALRIVVLEWQKRPANRMLLDSPYDEKIQFGPSIRENGLKTSISSPRSAAPRNQVGLEKSNNCSFDSSHARRQRLVPIYLSERRYILKTSEHIAFSALFEASLNASYNSGERVIRQASSMSGWIEEIGNEILALWNLNGVTHENGKNIIQNCVDALQSRIENLEMARGWLQDEDLGESIELAWGENQVLEMIHIMQIMLTLLNSSKQITRTDALLTWFRFIGKYCFFENFVLPFESIQGTHDLPLQSLVALISLSVLNIPLVLDMVAQISTTVIQTSIPKDDKPYILNMAAINELNDVLVDAAAACSTNASPAILAWSIILQTIREYALVSKEMREIRQSLRAADKYSAAEISDTDATERLSMSGNASHQRRSSTSSDTSQQTFLEEILEKVMDTALDEDPIGYLAKNAVDGSHVFNVTAALAIEYCSTFGSNHKGKPGLKIRRMLLDLIRAALDWIEYQPILLMAALAILTGDERYWDGSEREQGFKESDPSTFFLADNILMQKLFQTALARFPYESLPFLRLCRVLATSNSGEDEAPFALWSLIETIDSLTCVLPTGFSAYELIREDEDANYVQLTGNLKFFDGAKPASNLLGGMTPFFPASATTVFPMDSLELPAGTMGRVLSESKPLVVMWRYDYSALNYMGKILQYASTDWNSFSTISTTMASREVVSEIIELLTVIISSTGQKLADRKKSSTPYELAQTILENASDGLDRNQDVVSVVLDIFEKELHYRRNVSQEEDSLDILIRCIQFIHALLPAMPDRIWPFLGRSSLLGINGVESQLSFIITSTEMISGHYGFLLGCIRVYDALIDDAIAHAVFLNVPTTAVKRFGAADNAGLRVSQVTMEKVIISFQRIMIDVFESLSTWKSISHEEKLEMNTWMCSIFLKILNYSFNIDDRESIQQKLTKSFAPAAQYTLDVFLSTSDSNVTARPLLQLLLEGLATPRSSLLIRVSQLWISQTIVTINMVAALIRINSLLGHLSSNLENQIFMATPVLARLYATYETYRLPIVDLFDALICGADSADKQPPSLLGHLGQDTASCFLEMLSKIDQPLSDNNLSISLWGLLSTIVSKRQQWFAIFALTGNTPRNSLKDDKNHESITHQRAEPLLNIALNELSNIERLSPVNAIAMLEFAMLAANYWPWVLSTMEEHEDFLSAITKFIEFSGPDRSSTEEKLKELSNDFLRLQMSSYVIDILAMITHNSKQSGKGAYGKKLLPCLPLLNKLSVSIPGYNASLHGNLRHNFESRFSGCTLADFKRTKIKKSQLGPSFYYDLDMASSMLCIDPSWTGRHGQGFLEEMMRANTNLSLVESQVNLFHSWKFLAVELSQSLDTDSKFQSIMITTSLDCLRSNANSNLPQAIFERLANSRAQLAFALLERLIKVKSTKVDIQKILPAAWDALRAHETDIGLGLLGENAGFYRLLLKILCLALQTRQITPDAQSSGTDKAWSKNPDASHNSLASSKTMQPILGILHVVVAQGFRSLTTVLHEDSTLVVPADFVLIIAILRAALQVPGVENHTTEILSQFSDSQTVRCASALLSWSDQIATNHDPIYGELSIFFLLELSNISTLAETLAVEGILTQILSTNLISYLRQDRGMGPFDNPVRLYSIWFRGLLPLFLNLLHAVGAPMAPEIASTLNNFRGQLSRASRSFESKPISATDPAAGCLTLSMVSEAQNLAMITSILDTFREAGSSAGIIASQVVEPLWDKAQVKEDIELWMQRRSALRDRILPTNEKEEAWVRQPPVLKSNDADNRLEEKVVEEMKTVLMILDSNE